MIEKRFSKPQNFCLFISVFLHPSKIEREHDMDINPELSVRSKFFYLSVVCMGGKMKIVIVVIEKLIDIFNTKFGRQIPSSFNQLKFGVVIYFMCL